MLVIRFSRTGKKKQAQYRIIINEKTKDPWDRYLENLGIYDPKTKVAELKVDRIKYWLSKGAQPSATVWNLLVTKGIVEGKKKKVTKISQKRADKIAEAKKQAEPASAPAKPEVKAEEPAKPEVKVEEPTKLEVEDKEPAKPEVKVEEPVKSEVKAEDPAKEEVKAEEPAKSEKAPKTK